MSKGGNILIEELRIFWFKNVKKNLGKYTLKFYIDWFMIMLT